jgi:hypothetical protein
VFGAVFLPWESGVGGRKGLVGSQKPTNHKQYSQYSDLDYGLDDNTVKIPAGSGNISLLHNIEIGSGNHPVSMLSVYRGAPSAVVKRLWH